ncbi:A/G-specific adenine glycosylase [Ferviditalea candida]|uniref:Adenine DNA glycosylase n=1 Tax=Ferviditalea candida TaxID=3108399 RepID=A0ABU5ZID7_9BACL|nr:A/G-specific adenine glycosylase [Paenibacillaceae bacterium T2]
MERSTAEIRQYFSSNLLEWFRIHKRDLPWRRTNDPYRIMVSEIMLQQTRVDTVIPYYHRFIERFPTVEALAEAPEEDVLKAWEGLGYYSRARNLQTAVREVKERYGGRVPDKRDQIGSLKGVGPYTAGAVLSIAYNRPEPAVDGNVMRVFSRFFLILDDTSKPGTRTEMEKLARELIPEGEAGSFNQALMELGALICTPKSPNCLICPVMENCAGRLNGMEEQLPVKKKAQPPRREQRVVALIQGAGNRTGQILIRRRPDEGLLAGMWELPHYAAADADGMVLLKEKLLEEERLPIEPLGKWFRTNHTFSHIRWELDVYVCNYLGNPQGLSDSMDLPGSATGGGSDRDDLRWIEPQELERFVFPNVFIRIIREYAKRLPGIDWNGPIAEREEEF